MANWDKPDFEADDEVDAGAVSLRAQLVAEGKMDRWPHKGPAGFDKETVHRYCVDTSHHEVANWQRIRLSMKGKPTDEKLAILDAWWSRHSSIKEEDGSLVVERAVFVQVFNYLGALRRGGQLDAENRVRKYI